MKSDKLKFRLMSFGIGVIGLIIVGFHSWWLALGLFIYSWGLKLDVVISVADFYNKQDNHPLY